MYLRYFYILSLIKHNFFKFSPELDSAQCIIPFYFVFIYC